MVRFGFPQGEFRLSWTSHVPRMAAPRDAGAKSGKTHQRQFLAGLVDGFAAMGQGHRIAVKVGREPTATLLATTHTRYCETMKKYGRTFHLPISQGATSNDKIMSSLKGLMVDDLIITEKMDGENTTIHNTGTHARSPDSRYHPSRDWIKAFAVGISPQLEDGERIIGENLFAKHSVAYDALPSYFLGFSWIIGDYIQSWDDTVLRFEQLGITPVMELYRGPYTDQLFEDVAERLNLSKQEGFVARDASSFSETEMPNRMGKFVRANHVQSETHWMKAEMVPNRLAKN